jgi:hypothetical protein
VNEYTNEAHEALKRGRRVTIQGFGAGSAGMWAGVTQGMQGDRAGAAPNEYLLEVYGASGELVHRCSVDAEAARRLLVAGAIEL